MKVHHRNIAGRETRRFRREVRAQVRRIELRLAQGYKLASELRRPA